MTTPQITLVEANTYLTTARAILEQAFNKQGASLKQKTRLDKNGREDAPFMLLRDRFLKYEESVRKINYGALTKKQSRVLRKEFTKKFLPEMEKCAVNIIAHGFAAAYYGFSPNQYEVDGIVRHQVSQYARAEVNRMLGKTQASKTETIPLTPAPSNLVFPHLTAINYGVDKRVRELQTAWEKAAKQRNLTEDDQFLLQRIATDYLPDTWRMYTTISDMPRRVIDQATSMLITQVEVLHERVKEINQKHSGNALKELTVQTRFISQKRTRKQISHDLHLS